jgi:hypothetical protein
MVSLALGAVGLVGAAGGYLAAFGTLRRRSDEPANVAFFSTLAITLLLIGSGEILSGPALVAWWGGLAMGAAVLGARMTDSQLSLHAAVLAVAMAGASATLVWAAAVWFTAGPWLPLTAAHVASLAVAAACLVIQPKLFEPAPRGVLPLFASVSRFMLAAVLVAGSGGITVWWLAPLIAGEPVDGGVLASITTVVLAGSAVTVAALSRVTMCVEFRWLVYPVLVAGGLKLVVDDFRHSAPATLFAALAVYGVALILAPRLLRRS